MSRGSKIDLHRVTAILDRMAKGGGINQVADDLEGTSRQTVFKISKDFPLWEWFRTHPEQKP